MHDGCIKLRDLVLKFIFDHYEIILVLESFLSLLNLIPFFFCDYMNDCYTMVLIDPRLRGFDKPCLGKTNYSSP
jgi:hypothetical protein